MQTPAATVCFLGPPHSYSHLATGLYYGDDYRSQPASSIAEVFDRVAAGDCRWGVVPIENSTDGRIVDTMSRLIHAKVQIAGEVRLAIHHCLLAQTPEGIVEIQSKPQALSQCRNFLAEHYRDVVQTAVCSTAAAAAAAAADCHVAAVASRRAGEAAGLSIIAENIEDNANNVTRFVVIGTETSRRTGDDKTSLLFQVAHQPGSLADAMMVFKTHGLNLTFIESFPSPGQPDEYQFFVELDGHRDDTPVQSAVDDLRRITHRMVVLGSYAKWRSR